MTEQLIPLLMAPAVSLLVEVAKRVPVVPFDGQRRAAVLAALVVVSLAVRVALAYVGGQLHTINWATELQIVADAVLAAFAAAGTYSLVRR